MTRTWARSAAWAGALEDTGGWQSTLDGWVDAPRPRDVAALAELRREVGAAVRGV